MIFRSLAVAATIVLSAGSAIAADAPMIIPLEFGPRPTAMVTIGANPPVKMVFDTGAMGMAIDAALAKSYGLAELGAVLVGSPGHSTD